MEAGPAAAGGRRVPSVAGCARSPASLTSPRLPHCPVRSGVQPGVILLPPLRAALHRRGACTSVLSARNFRSLGASRRRDSSTQACVGDWRCLVGCPEVLRPLLATTETWMGVLMAARRAWPCLAERSGSRAPGSCRRRPSMVVTYPRSLARALCTFCHALTYVWTTQSGPTPLCVHARPCLWRHAGTQGRRHQGE